MKCLIVAVNAKYIHSSGAVYSLKTYADCFYRSHGVKDIQLKVMEFTINQPELMIYYDLLKEQADVIAFACYLWNITMIRDLLRDLKAVRPALHILLGGPEVSYGLEGKALDASLVDGIIAGEGERAFTASLLMEASDREADLKKRQAFLSLIPESWKIEKDAHVISAFPIEDLAELPFLYEDLTPFKDRILYYEASRGCPFSCSYCLSSVETGGRKVRELPLERVFSELAELVKAKVKTIKFVDRTFNCHPKRAEAILDWIFRLPEDCDTTFHFEIEAGILSSRLIEQLNGMPDGRVQVEAGIQSTCPEALMAVSRSPKVDVIFAHLKKLLETDNVNVHVDLIAGLPYENLQIFKQSFNDVYSLHAHQFQLGFLKLLSGSPMEQEREAYGYVFSQNPPYEILRNRYVSTEDLYYLKQIEDVLEKYWNSCRFKTTMLALEPCFDSPFELMDQLREFLDQNGALLLPAGMQQLFDLLSQWLISLYEKELFHKEALRKFQASLLFDFYAASASDHFPLGLEKAAQGALSPKARKMRAEEILRSLDEKNPAVKNHRVRVRPIFDQLYAFDYSEKNKVWGTFICLGNFPS
ncbi:MAG: DUF4080 domain-containing protein [Firmicutes bacterium]|nr:DUF4080 domain-containing protein [Bacillota bacterium]